jgi:hypothetical protein
MVPADSGRISPVPPYSGYCSSLSISIYVTITRYGPTFQMVRFDDSFYSIIAYRHRIASGARSPWPLQVGSLRTPCGAFAGPFAVPPAPAFGFHPWGRACRGPLIGPRTRTVSHPRPGPQRCLALAIVSGPLQPRFLSEPNQQEKSRRTRPAGRHRHSTGLTAWDGR